MQTNKGLNSFQIKMIALFFMLLDHIHYILAGVFHIPIIFTILGRISAPLFIFISIISITHTSSPKKYLLKLWIGFVFMNIGNDIINKFFPLASGGIIINNIFGTLFCICFIVHFLDKFKKDKNIKYLLFVLLPIISGFIILTLMSNQNLLILFRIFFYTIPNCIFCEGGFIFVILGIIFYIFKDNKKLLAISYTIFCIFILLMGYNSSAPLKSMFIWDIQYFMILSLPFILLYNGEKGKSIKYFFYIFYPTHIYLLTILAFILDKIKS